MAELLRQSQVQSNTGRRRTLSRVPAATTGRLKNLALVNKEGSDAPDSSRQIHVRLENSYRMKPQEADKFQSWKVEQVMHEVLEQRLRDVTYDPVSCQTIAKELATEIQKRVKNFRWQRYRVICQVTLGQQTQQGVQVASRSLWDPAVDSHASITYDNKSVFAVAQCYGVYFE